MGDRGTMRHISPGWVQAIDWARRLRLAQLGRAWGVIGLVLVLAWLMGLSIGSIPEDLQEGAIAPYDVRADREYRLLDEVATNAARAEELKSVLPVYDFYTGMGATMAERLRAAFEATRKKVQEMTESNRGAQQAHSAGEGGAQRALPAGSEKGNRERDVFAGVNGTPFATSRGGATRAPGIDEADQAVLRLIWEEAAVLKLTDAQWAALVAEEWSPTVQEAIAGQVLRIMARPIVAEQENFSANQERGVVVRRTVSADAVNSAEELLWRGKTVADVLSIEGARRVVKGRLLRERLRHPEQTEELLAIAAQAVQPNCGPNVLETETRRAQAVKGVPDRQRLVQAGEVIVRRGEPYTAEDLFLLEGIRRQKDTGAAPLKLLGTALFVAVLILLVHAFGTLFVRKYAPQRRDLLFLGCYLVVMVGLLRMGAILTELLADDLRLSIPRFAYAYLMPLAAGGMLVRFLINSETALLFSVILAVLTGIIFPQDPSYTAFGLVAGIAGAATIAHADKRAAIIRAGLVSGLVCMLTVVGVQLMRAGALAEMLTWTNLCWYVLLAFIGAMVAAVLVLTLTPVAESVFGYTTDIKLLELANLNHPLLRELIIRAPGTYHHSHLVGILAETGAQAIHANPLLARVGAYYHDIGKIRKPLYFAENLKDGESRHGRLTPHMSALIISSHIKDGLELARAYKLPERIAAMIPQHHGTNRIGCFFERAKEAADPALGVVEEKDYRYPGPKPQSREAGILMLSDQTEGAVRALREKTPTRIQQTVEQIINKSFAEGQLDECELTLKNLNEIGRAFARILLGIYHQRIEYPRETLKLHEKDVQVFEEGALQR